jgi:anionic cell wall polymer biosynthesis LytR-Cps2A-Psr (LCP) family protein
MVEDYTGILIDHLARIDFDGFTRLVDALGGIRVCVDRPRREGAHLYLEGCQTLDGETALAWVRARHLQELVDGQWRNTGENDFGRQKAQQDVLFQLAARAAGFISPADLSKRLTAVAASVRFDSSWSFVEAIGTAWRYRGITRSDVRRFSIDVADYRTSYGAAVLLPLRIFGDQLAEVYDFG